VFHRYGHALLEHAISTSGALGGGGGSGDAPMPTRSAKKSGSSPPPDPRFSFGGDGPDSDDEDAAEGAEGAAPGEGGEEEEEDDLSVAFSVLELARVRYEKILELGGDQATLTTLDDETWGVSGIKAQLAEVLNDLGDVGLESGEWPESAARG
jgi:HAT1-interacting factor 1